MKNSVLTAVLLSALAGSALAGDVQINDIVRFADGLGSTNGGEFNATNISNGSSTFRTFCVQLAENLDFSNPFRVAGIGFNSVVLNGNINPTGALAPETAYLYTLFRAGTLPNYGSVASANDLQNAIWHFQGQGNSGGATNQYGLLATAATSGMNPTWTGYGNVRILNMVYANGGGNAQDVLALIPLPTGGMLALAGLGGLAIRRRRVA